MTIEQALKIIGDMRLQVQASGATHDSIREAVLIVSDAVNQKDKDDAANNS